MRTEILAYGLIAGAIIGIPTFALTLIMGNPSAGLGMAFGYFLMLVALSAIFVAIKRHRDAGGGVIRFWPALGMGVAISIVASLCYIIAWEAALAVTGGDFIDALFQQFVSEKQASGATPEAVAQFAAEMEAFKADYANPLVRIPMTFTEIFPVGVLVSLISAGLLSNSRFLAVRR